MSVPSLTRFKPCTKCGMTWSFEMFHRASKHSTGRESRCKLCSKRYHEANRERRLAYLRSYYLENKEHASERSRARYWSNPERYREQVRRYNKTNPEKVLIWSRNKRARLMQAEGSHTFDEVWQMYEDQQGLCAYCETPLFGQFQVDHMLPLVRGGSNEWLNLAVTCCFCNNSKNKSTAEEFMERVRRV